jgi:hypothetical protein
LCGCGLLTIPWLRGEKLRLLILRNQIETSAAPDEPVLIDDWLLDRALRWKGSDALQHQLVYIRHNALPPQILSAQQEMVMAVPEDDTLLKQLQGRGLTLAPNVSQAAWVASGKGFHSPGRHPFRIYFIMRPSPGTQPTATPAEAR